MKKLLSVLLMVTCLLGLTACGTDKDTVAYEEQEVQMLCDMIYGLTASEMPDEQMAEFRAMDDYEVEQNELSLRSNFGLKIPFATLLDAIDARKKADEEVGNASETLKYDISSDKSQITALVTVDGSKHDLVYEIVFDAKLAVESITLSVQYSMGELMEKAALNTLLGMGTVFVVLILISALISTFTFIPKIQAALSRKSSQDDNKTDSKSETKTAVDNTIAHIIKKEELSDDLELVAVISAAIAASQGAVTTEGFVVRSIRKANRRK